MKTLYLLRHTKAEPGGSALADEDRPLAARGRDASRRMGVYMQQQRYLPEFTICSTSARTRETLEILAASHGGEFSFALEKKLYLATPGEMLAQIHAVSDAYASLLVIGHNPGMHHLAATLASDKHTPLREKLELKYPTGALAVLAFDTAHWKNIAPEGGALKDFVLPNDL